ncbi:hypothetical protein DFH08DRAFT_819651 [Mycena albidolilacea]|uniref:Uncharacterized protein n=1 Tax=Mycena albidolilacea TaxID=1033008 RepID=A0AAD6ZEG0_9AGAR|nr:hypothetical protein DFH08DRAFT_819651 [Mycena albidolilacea]
MTPTSRHLAMRIKHECTYFNDDDLELLHTACGAASSACHHHPLPPACGYPPRPQLALAGSREDTGAGGFQAGNTLRIDVHCVVVVEERHCRWYHRGVLWSVEGGRESEDACLTRASAWLQVSSSAGKPSAGGSDLPKNDQGGRRFVSSAHNTPSLDIPKRDEHKMKRLKVLVAVRIT